MDGVLADFDRYADRVLAPHRGKTLSSTKRWSIIASNPRLYRDLEKTPEADQLVKYCQYLCEVNDWDLRILTAIPIGNDIPWAFHDKFEWINQHFPQLPIMFGPYSGDKFKHCQPGDVLIDDRISNIQEWEAANGIGILHRGDIKQTINRLDQIAK